MGLFDEAISPASLRAAFEQCRWNAAGPGPDGVTTAAFAASADAELDRLHQELATGQWHPRPLRTVKIPKAGGGARTLAIGCVRDRVVQHAVAATLSLRLDDTLHPCAYAWRRGRSAKQALERVDAAMSAGYEWAFRGDIEEFFDRIPRPMVSAALLEVTADDALVALVERLLAAGAMVGGQVVDPVLGTGQGSPLSPFLANLYLLPFDQAMEGAGFAMVRYGDDLCVPGATKADVERAHIVARDALARLRLALNPNKVELRHRGEGFVFLGFQFDAGGRRASTKARRSVAQQLEALAREGDAPAVEVDALLRGWSTYYGSLAGIDIPPALRERAEALDRTRTQDAQVGALNAPASTANADARWEPGAAPAPAAPATSDPWQRAALQLVGAVGTPDEAAVSEGLRASLDVPRDAWPALARALGRFDGEAVAEGLAALDRYGDAAEATRLTRPAAAPAFAGARGVPVAAEDVDDPPRFAPDARDAELLLERFGGAEGAFLRDLKVGDRIERERVMRAARVDEARAHLAGTFWLGAFPLRANNTVRFAAVRLLVAPNARKPGQRTLPPEVDDATRRVLAAAQAYELQVLHSVEPGRARVVWFLFAEAIAGPRARALLSLVVERAGATAASVSRELLPAQDSAKPDKPGTGILLPLGLDPRSGERAWFCDDALRPVIDPCAHFRAAPSNATALVAKVVGVKPKLPVLQPSPPPVEPPRPAAPAAATTDAPAVTAAPDAVALATSPFRDLPRAQEVYKGCNILRHFVDAAIAGRGMAPADRMFVAGVLGRLGEESVPALEGVLRHLEDWRPGMAARHLQRLYPHPTSCGRVRATLPELTARLGCDCRFRVPPGAYPTPVLHAVGAAEVLGLAERVKDAASRGGLARAAVESMNEGRKALGAKASALCTRLADLRRQTRMLEQAITKVEEELDGVLDEAGDARLETPSGTLVRVTGADGRRRFVLEV